MVIHTMKSRGRLILKGGGDDTGWPLDTTASRPPSPPSGPMTRARTKALHDKVNSLLSTLELDTPLDGILPHTNVLCILSYDPTGATRAERYGTGGFVKKRGEAGVSRAPAVVPLAPPVLPLATGSGRYQLPQLPPTTANASGSLETYRAPPVLPVTPTGTTGRSGSFVPAWRPAPPPTTHV